MIRSDGPWCLRCAAPLCTDGTCGACDYALTLARVGARVLARKNARGRRDSVIELRDLLSSARSTLRNLEVSPW